METTKFLSPIGIIFLFGSNEIRDGSYQKTVTAYKESCGGNFNVPPLAYVKIPEHEKALLPDVVDFLLDNDVKPIAAVEGFDGKIFPQQERSKDILKLFMLNETHQYSFTLFVVNGLKINTNQLYNYFNWALDILYKNKEVVSIGFDGGLNLNQISALVTAAPSFTFIPFIIRSRDLMIAAKIVMDNASQLNSLTSEQAFNQILGSFSYHPYKFLSFVPKNN